MKNFFNYLVCISVLFLVGLSGATFYISMDIEKMFYKKELFTYGNNVVFYNKIISYKKGLFESNAVTEVKLLNFPTVIKMHHTILHGPIIFTKDSKKPIDFKFAIINSYIDKSANTAIPISFVISTVLNYKKEIESTTNSSFPKYEGRINSSFPKDANNLVQIANWLLESFIRITNNHVDFKCTASFSSALAKHLGDELVVEGVNIKVNQTAEGVDLGAAIKANQTVGSFESGEGNVAIDVKKIIQKQQETEITNLKLNETNTVKNKILNNSFDLDIEKIINKNEIYGPMHFKFLLENINLSQISNPQPELKPRSLRDLTASLAALLLKKPKLIIDNSYLSFPNGAIKVNLVLSFSELESNSNNISANADLMQRVGMDGEVSLTISKEVLKQMITKSIQNGLVMQMEYEKLDPQKKQQELDMQANVNLQQAIQNGILIEKEEAYETKITVVQNNFIVNDKPITEPFMVFINYMAMFKASHVTVKNPPAQQPILPPVPVNDGKS